MEVFNDWKTQTDEHSNCSTDPLDEKAEADLKRNEGFIFNSRRGTANFFSTDALISFLQRNNLSHVIRAHEVQEVGFQVGGDLFLSRLS